MRLAVSTLPGVRRSQSWCIANRLRGVFTRSARHPDSVCGVMVIDVGGHVSRNFAEHQRGIGKRAKLLGLLVATKGYSAWRCQPWIFLRCSATKTGGQIFSDFEGCEGMVGTVKKSTETIVLT
jgi:hypothetical protein